MNILYYILLIGSSNMIWACSDGNHGHDTEIDSTEFREHNQLLEGNRDENGTNELNGEKNGVNSGDVNDTLDWPSLREFVKQSDSIPNKEMDEVQHLDDAYLVIEPWNNSGEYIYRRVLRNRNNRLYLQTHLKDRNAEADQTNNIFVLNRDVADSLKLSKLWTDMEGMAIHMADSLRDQ